MGHSLIGMTQAVEAKLARELEMCFLPLAFVTDYDCWHQSEEAVSVEMVIANLKQGVARIKQLLPLLIRELPQQRDACSCASALAASIITAPVHDPGKDLQEAGTDHRQIHHVAHLRRAMPQELILVINPGNTSTKVAVYDGLTPAMRRIDQARRRGAGGASATSTPRRISAKT